MADYSGTFSEGNSVTITMLGAGNSASQDNPDAPLISENFESIPLDTEIGGISPDAGSWEFGGNDNGTYVKDASPLPHGGTKYSQALSTNNGNWWGQFVVPITGNPNKLYHEFWGYVSHSDGINKMMQIHGNANGSDFSPAFHFGSFTETFTDLNNGATIDNWGWTWEQADTDHGLYGEWVLYRVMGKQSGSNTEDGVMKCRATKIAGGVNSTVNLTTPIPSGDTTLNEDACRTRLLDTTSWEEVSCNHGGSVNMTGAPVTTGVDEVWTAKSWARVVITDTVTAPDLSVNEDFTEYSIQPITSWTDTAVTIKCNKGMLSAFIGSYVHVFDNANTRIKVLLIGDNMAVLISADRKDLSTKIQRDLSKKRRGLALTKSELRAAINAVDQWINDNRAALNAALPVAARNNLTAAHKADLLTYVAGKRSKVGV